MIIRVTMTPIVNPKAMSPSRVEREPLCPSVVIRFLQRAVGSLALPGCPFLAVPLAQRVTCRGIRLLSETLAPWLMRRAGRGWITARQGIVEARPLVRRRLGVAGMTGDR